MHDAEVEAKWQHLRRRLDYALSGTEVGRIPGWEPVPLAQVYDWVQAHVYEGFYVSFLVEDKVVWLKEWEYGFDEPSWDSIKAIPIDPPDSTLAIW